MGFLTGRAIARLERHDRVPRFLVAIGLDSGLREGCGGRDASRQSGEHGKSATHLDGT